MYHVIRGGLETKHPNTFVRNRPNGIPNYLILIIHTAGQFYINGTFTQIAPGHALLLSPGVSYRYGNPNGVYIDDWLHFSIEGEENNVAFNERVSIMNQLFPISDTKMFTSFIRQILWEASYSKPPYKKSNIDSLFNVLINHLLFAHKNQKAVASGLSSYDSQLQALRLEMQNTLQEQPNIKDYAHRLGVSESYFQHLYSNYFGISFQKDLIRIRMEEAQYLLSTTNATMEEIAEQCGYTSDIHFYRQFKSFTHITPGQYRKYGPPIYDPGD